MEYKLVKYDSNTGYCTWEDGENRRAHETDGSFLLQFGNHHVSPWEGDGAAQNRVSEVSWAENPAGRPHDAPARRDIGWVWRFFPQHSKKPSYNQ